MAGTEILQEAIKDHDKIIKDRRYLHTHPGTGFDIEETVAYVKKALMDMGYDPQPCGKAGLVALVGGKKPGKVFMLRGDMDALPMVEEADVDEPSTNGKMHACGHDFHTSMLLEAARLLKAHEDEIEGTVKLMFQPAEEIFEGAQDMIRSGVLKNPEVDAALMMHVMAGMPFSAGTAIVCDGGVSAPAADYFTIKVQGKGCHGSMPNVGVDPINVAAHMITALQTIHARELALSDEAILTIGSIHGGSVGNVIPDCVEMQGSIRTYDEAVRGFMKERMVSIVENIAASFRAEATVSFGSGCPTLVNDASLSNCVVQYIQELNGTGSAFTAGQLAALSGAKKVAKTAGSEDFAYVSQEVPSIMLALAAGHPEKGYIYPQHHPKVKFDEAALPVGAAIYAYTAMRWLQDQRHQSKA